MRDRPRPVELPATGVDHPKIRPVAAKYAQLRQHERGAQDVYARLQDERVKAMQNDRQALADAKRAGKADPGYAAVTKADAAIAAARRDLEALEVAVDDQRRELVATIEKHRGDWRARIDGQIGEVRAQYGQAVEDAAALHAKMADAHALRGWLDGFPDRTRWKPSLVRVTSMRMPSGEGYEVAQLLSALREHAQAPPAPALAALSSVQQGVGDAEMLAWHTANGGRSSDALSTVRDAYLKGGPRRDEAARDAMQATAERAA